MNGLDVVIAMLKRTPGAVRMMDIPVLVDGRAVSVVRYDKELRAVVLELESKKEAPPSAHEGGI